LVKGLSQEEATDKLKEAHLLVGTVLKKHKLNDPGTVVGQTPIEGKLEWHTRVDLVVSLGPASIEVPSVEGMKLAKAEKILEDEGFTTVVVEEFSDDVDKGDVIATSPAGLASAPEGSEVQIIVSTGPEFKELVLPDVRQMDVDAATDLLESKGLRVTVEASGACAGGRTVVDTSPKAGETVHENDEIALFVC
jgi:serine/threonine-protein kinase